MWSNASCYYSSNASGAKRKQDWIEEQPKKKEKRSSEMSFHLNEDVCFYILQFVDWKTLLTSCKRVSKLWFNASSYLKVMIRKYDQSIKALVNCPFMINLTVLHLDKDRKDGDACAYYIAWSEHMRGLTDLSLPSVSPYGVSSIASSVYMSNLKILTLHGGGIDSIASSFYITQLTSLEVHEASFYDFSAIANCENMKQLTRLHLIGNDTELNAESISNFVKSPYLNNLTDLSLDKNKLQESSVKEITNSTMVQKLQVLSLSKTSLTLTGVDYIAKSPQLKSLTNLKLSNNFSNKEDIQTATQKLKSIRLLEI